MYTYKKLINHRYFVAGQSNQWTFLYSVHKALHKSHSTLPIDYKCVIRVKEVMLEINNTAFFYGDFTKVREQFTEACEWIDRELGFKYKSTRIGEYEDNLKLFVNEAGTIPEDDKELMDRFYIFMQSATEACQIIRIWNTFKGGDHKGLRERVKEIMKGKSLRPEAIKKNSKNNSDDPARDFSFELNIASRFLKSGYDIDLTEECDVVVDLNGKKLYVECKRIKSSKQLKKRVKSASEQITRRIGANRNKKYGLVALDVTDILIPDGTVTITSSLASFNHRIKRLVTDYAKENSEILSKNITRDVIGVLFEFSSSSFIYNKYEEPQLGFGRSTCMSIPGIKKKKSLAVVSEFIDKIANQHI